MKLSDHDRDLLKQILESLEKKIYNKQQKEINPLV